MCGSAVNVCVCGCLYTRAVSVGHGRNRLVDVGAACALCFRDGHPRGHLAGCLCWCLLCVQLPVLGPALGCPQFCRTQGKAFDIALGQVRVPPAARLLVSAACVHSAMAGGTSVGVDRSPQGGGGGVRPGSQEAPGGKGPRGGRGQPATRLAPMALSHTLVSGGLESSRSLSSEEQTTARPCSWPRSAWLLLPHARVVHRVTSSLGPCCLLQQGLRDPGLLVGCFYKCPGIT